MSIQKGLINLNFFQNFQKFKKFQGPIRFVNFKPDDKYFPSYLSGSKFMFIAKMYGKINTSKSPVYFFTVKLVVETTHK